MMKLKTLFLATATCLTLTACSTTPPVPETTVGVIEEVSNIKARVVVRPIHLSDILSLIIF